MPMAKIKIQWNLRKWTPPIAETSEIRTRVRGPELFAILLSRVYESRARGGGEYRTCYKYGANRWESNVTSGVLHVRLTSY